MNTRTLVRLSITLVWSSLLNIQDTIALQDLKESMPQVAHSQALVSLTVSVGPSKDSFSRRFSRETHRTQLNKAYQLYNCGELLQALHFVEEASPVVKYNFGVFLLENGNLPHAKALFQALADTSLTAEEIEDDLTCKSVASALFNFALILEETKDAHGNLRTKDALAYYLRAASLGCLDANCNAAVLLYKAKDYEGALELLKHPAKEGDEDAADLLFVLDWELKRRERSGHADIIRQLLLYKSTSRYYLLGSSETPPLIGHGYCAQKHNRERPVTELAKKDNDTLSNCELIGLLDQITKIPRIQY